MLFNTQMCNNKELASFELLWTNQNLSTSFSATTLNLPTGFDAFVIGFNSYSTITDYPVYVYVPFSTSSRFYMVRNDDTPRWSAAATWREVIRATDGVISFGNGYHQYQTDDTKGIPVSIFGLHFTV